MMSFEEAKAASMDLLGGYNKTNQRDYLANAHCLCVNLDGNF